MKEVDFPKGQIQVTKQAHKSLFKRANPVGLRHSQVLRKFRFPDVPENLPHFSPKTILDEIVIISVSTLSHATESDV